MAENYSERSKEDLLNIARERDLSGRSSMDKDELAKALAKDDEGSLAGKDSPASDPKDPAVQESLSPEGQEALEEYGEDSAALEESDLALDASGPLHLEKPSERVMTGAVNEEHAQELQKAYDSFPEEWVGDMPEKPSDEQIEAANTAVDAQNNPKTVDPNDVYENKDETLADREEAVKERRADLFERDTSQRRASASEEDKVIEETQGHQGPVVDNTRTFHQRAQLYTDGVSGPGANRLDRAFANESLRSGIFHDTFNQGTPRDEEVIEAEKERREATDYK